MSRYSYIYSQIWTDKKFLELSEDEKILFLYLLSSPHSNIAGYYRLPVTYATADLGWEAERFIAGMERLESARIAFYDVDNSVVLVRNFLKYNRILNVKQAKGAMKQITETPASPLIGEMFLLWKRYVTPNDGVSVNFEEDLSRYAQAVSVPAGYPIEEQVQNTGTGTGADTAQKSESVLKRGHQASVDEKFAVFWEAYPKKVDKKAARRSFARLFPPGKPGAVYERTLSGISDRLGEYLEELLRTGVEPRYVKNPSSWLNAQEFEDGV